MARINNTQTNASDITWIDDAELDHKVDVWKAKGYTLDSVIKSLRAQDFKVKSSEGEMVSVSLGKLNRAWHAEIVELD